MTHARPVQPGTTHLFTRRCIGRMFGLRPDRFTTECFRYCLAYSANKHGMLVYAAVQMSNHYHAVVHDPRGRYPKFLQEFHSLLTRSLNIHRQREGTMWERKSTHELTLVEPAKVLEKMAYVVSNPVDSDLVSKAASWPGFTSAKHKTGDTLVVKRPRGFFNGRSGLPEEVELHIAKPVEFAKLTNQQFERCLQRDVKKRQLASGRRRRDLRKPVLGADAAKRQSLDAKPLRREPFRRMVPRIVASNRELFRAQLKLRRAFVDAYTAARKQMIETQGTQKKPPVFPPGTWGLWSQGLVQRLPS